MAECLLLVELAAQADIPEPPINVRYGGKADDAIAAKRAVPGLKNDPSSMLV